MSVQLSDLKPGAVVVGQDGKIAVVVSVDLNRPRRPVSVRMKAGGTLYVAGVDMFSAVVGQVDMAKFDGAVQAAPMWTPLSSVESFGLPENIKAMDLKAGDLIRFKHGGKVATVTFNGFNWNRPKYPVSYALNGKQWKGKVEGIVEKAA